MNIFRNSFQMEPYQLKFLNLFFQYMKQYGYEGYCGFLDQFALQDIKFKYVPAFAFSEIFQGITGAWGVFSSNTVFLAPGQNDIRNIPYLEYKDRQDKISSINIMNRPPNPLAEKIDLPRYNAVSNISGNSIGYEQNTNGNPGMTALHQLYHKWQFKHGGLMYLVNMILGKLIGYENSSKLNFFIQGDVRRYIDNQYNSDINDKFVRTFSMLSAYFTAKILHPDQTDSALKELESADTDILFLITEYLNEQKIIPEEYFLEIKNHILIG